MAGLNGDASTRGYSGEVILVMDIGDMWEKTPDILSIRYQKECPHCGEVIEAERFPTPASGENNAESISRTYDRLVTAFSDHVENNCEGGSLDV